MSLILLLMILTGCEKNVKEIEEDKIELDQTTSIQEKYVCPDNYNLEDGNCILKISNIANVDYSCDEGYTINGNQCTKEEIIEVETEMRCFDKITPGGNKNCPLLVEIDPIYNDSSCPSGYKEGSNYSYFSKNDCVKVVSSQKASCISGYSLQNGSVCIGQNYSYPFLCPSKSGSTAVYNHSNGNCEYYSIIEKAQNTGYSCLTGYKLNSDTQKCETTIYTNGYHHTTCPEGYDEYYIGECKRVITKKANETYSCKEGTLEGKNCVKTLSKESTTEKFCPKEYIMSDKECILENNK